MLAKSIPPECEMAAERDSRRERCDCFTSVGSPERKCDLQTNGMRTESQLSVLSCPSSPVDEE